MSQSGKKDVDARDKRGHDELETYAERRLMVQRPACARSQFI
jgi:hypothetical protein